MHEMIMKCDEGAHNMCCCGVFDCVGCQCNVCFSCPPSGWSGHGAICEECFDFCCDSCLGTETDEWVLYHRSKMGVFCEKCFHWFCDKCLKKNLDSNNGFSNLYNTRIINYCGCCTGLYCNDCGTYGDIEGGCPFCTEEYLDRCKKREILISNSANLTTLIFDCIIIIILDRTYYNK
eukprot:UN06280